jgi:hypothetical protein
MPIITGNAQSRRERKPDDHGASWEGAGEWAAHAFREFDAWVVKNDPDGTMDLLERINAYAIACAPPEPEADDDRQ